MDEDDEARKLRKKNVRLLIGILLFALALCALVIILMNLRGPAHTL